MPLIICGLPCASQLPCNTTLSSASPSINKVLPPLVNSLTAAPSNTTVLEKFSRKSIVSILPNDPANAVRSATASFTTRRSLPPTPPSTVVSLASNTNTSLPPPPNNTSAPPPPSNVSLATDEVNVSAKPYPCNTARFASPKISAPNTVILGSTRSVAVPLV